MAEALALDFGTATLRDVPVVDDNALQDWIGQPVTADRVDPAPGTIPVQGLELPTEFSVWLLEETNKQAAKRQEIIRVNQLAAFQF